MYALERHITHTLTLALVVRGSCACVCGFVAVAAAAASAICALSVRCLVFGIRSPTLARTHTRTHTHTHAYGNVGGFTVMRDACTRARRTRRLA